MLNYQFIYLISNISFTESDVNIRVGKFKSDISDKIKQDFSKGWLCEYYCMDAPSGHKGNALRKS